MYHAQTCAVILVLVSLLDVKCGAMETNMTTTMTTTTMTTPTKATTKAMTDATAMTTTMNVVFPNVSKVKSNYTAIYKLLTNTTLTTSELLKAIKEDNKYNDFRQELNDGKDLTETQLTSLKAAAVKAESESGTTLNPENGCTRNHVAIGSVVLVTVMSMFLIN